MMDSLMLTDQVVDRLDGKVPLLDLDRPGVNINLHAIVIAVLDCLKEAGFVNLEKPVAASNRGDT